MSLGLVPLQDMTVRCKLPVASQCCCVCSAVMTQLTNTVASYTDIRSPAVANFVAAVLQWVRGSPEGGFVVTFLFV